MVHVPVPNQTLRACLDFKKPQERIPVPVQCCTIMVPVPVQSDAGKLLRIETSEFIINLPHNIPYNIHVYYE